MKHLYKTLFILSLTLLTGSAWAQWTVGATGGLLNYYGDASQNNRFNPNSSRPGGALSIETKLGSFLRPQLQIMGGRLYGKKDYLDVQMKSTHIEASLKLGVDVMGLINSDSKLEISGNIAGVGAYYTPEVTYQSNEAPVIASHINQGENMGFGFGWGGRLGYEFNSSFKGLAGIDMRYYLTNQIDAYDGTLSTTNDWLSYIYAGVGYTFGGDDKIADEEGAPDPRRLFVGQFTYNNLPKSGVKLNLFDEDDNLMSSTETNMDGSFNFAGLKPGKDYTVRIDDEDADVAVGGKIFVVNAAGARVEESKKKGTNKFAYTHMSQDDVNEMAEIEVDDSETTLTGLFTYKKLAKGGVKLNLYDNSGVKIASTVSDIGGKFKFEGLTPDEKYIVKLNEDDKDLFNQGKLYLINDEGKRVAASERPDFNEFKFTHLTTANRNMLPVLEESDAEADMRAGREKDAKFSFEAMDEEDIATLQVLHVEVAGEGKMLYRRETFDGEFIKGEELDSNAMEGFELVGKTPDSKDKPRDPNEALYDVSFEKETIFFEHNKYSISQNQEGSKGSVIAKKLKANPAMRIEIQGYASQLGTEAYNILLSQRRADQLKNLLVEKYGIDAGRIVPVGRGEDPSCSEAEARRARIIILE